MTLRAGYMVTTLSLALLAAGCASAAGLTTRVSRSLRCVERS